MEKEVKNPHSQKQTITKHAKTNKKQQKQPPPKKNNNNQTLFSTTIIFIIFNQNQHLHIFFVLRYIHINIIFLKSYQLDGNTFLEII